MTNHFFKSNHLFKSYFYTNKKFYKSIYGDPHNLRSFDTIDFLTNQIMSFSHYLLFLFFKLVLDYFLKFILFKL